MSNTRTYLPAAGHDWALPLYDPFVKLMGIERTRKSLIDQATIRPGDRVLDIGCGTGSLLLLVKQRHPQASVVGLDPDPKALARARTKAERAAIPLQLDRGFSDEMPYADASFDRVLSSFMYHHLPKEAKTRTLAEVRRVLTPGGSLHVLDFAEARPGAHGFLMKLFHSERELKENAEDRMVSRMREAGFVAAERLRQEAIFFGNVRLNYYRGNR